MPTYEYKCPKCGTEFERFQKITAPPALPCPKCGSTAERLLSGGAGLVFKGSGFYETDYKRPSEKAKHQRQQKRDGGEKPSGTAPAKTDSTKPNAKAD
jgi:putative FmdB family regulatory protein